MNSYFTSRNLDTQKKLENVLNDLPDFCKTFFVGISNTTGALTRLNYAYDIRLFLNYLAKQLKIPVKSITLEQINGLNVHDIEDFIASVSVYENNENKLVENRENGKARKIAAIRTMFKYFYKNGEIDANAASLVDLPKIHEKAIIRLDVDEVVKLLDAVENGEGLSKREKQFHEHTKDRDLAVITLLLGTGIRVSECVGLNLNDVDLRNLSISVTRKGGNQAVLYINDEVAEALDSYLATREKLLSNAEDKTTPAFFLSLRGERITTRAVEKLVKKYAAIVTPLKHITPHKLRSTYGTTLYRETGDIYLVADVLGHKDVNTTRKHYAAQAEENRRLAASTVKLRKD